MSNIMNVQTKIELEVSKSGLTCFWEAGGSYTNTGGSNIVCDHFGNPKRAIYVRSHGDLCNGQHALIPVVVGDVLVFDDHHRGNHEVHVWEIVKIEDGKATLELVEYTKSRRADEEPAYAEAVQAAMEKATAYHCREVYFAQPPSYMRQTEDMYSSHCTKYTTDYPTEEDMGEELDDDFWEYDE